MRKIITTKAVSIVEVLVAIVLTSIILLSMTKVVALTLKNASESEASDIAIQQFAKAEENFKSFYISPTLDTNPTFLSKFCNLKASDPYIDITKPYQGIAQSAVPTIDTTSLYYKSAQFPSGAVVDLITNPSVNLPSYMWVSTKVVSPTTSSVNGTDQIQANTYVYWQLNGKQYFYTNSIYLYTGDKCIIP